jgi:hypothetical protein
MASRKTRSTSSTKAPEAAPKAKASATSRPVAKPAAEPVAKPAAKPAAKPIAKPPTARAAKAVAPAASAAPTPVKPAPRKRSAAKARAPAATPVAPDTAPRQGAEPEPAAVAKLALGPGAETSEPRPTTIPWSYGLDRITAAAIDPDQLHAYWEVTDAAIERARQALGSGGPGAWLCLRVYDTTGLLFDGTNAHGYFDHAVDRAARQWFFHVGKPTSTAFVEVGLKSSEGYFSKIARSGRVDFPRREPAPWRDPEWMTVETWTGQVAGVHRAPAPMPHRAPPAGGGGAPERFEQIPLWLMRQPGEGYEVMLREAIERGWERVEWKDASGESWSGLEGRLEWESPHVVSTWEAGPFAHPVEIEPPSREAWQGRSFAWRVGGVTHVVYGPWRVVIRNLGAHAEHAVLGAWVIYRSWAVEAGHEARPGRRLAVRSGASELLALGASERRWIAGSEVRLGGASELWRAGASEIAYRGASEQLFLGASQSMARGASERWYAGASERRLGGASERALPGGSEGRLGGASDQRPGGAGTSGEPLAYPPVPSHPTSKE